MAYRSNLVGREPPTATDDVNKGYRIGSRWIDKTHNRKYTCTDATNRAAIWIEDYADVTDPVSVEAAGAVMESYTHPQEPPCRAATAAQTGHATAAQITKLDGIETGATKYPDTGEQAFLDADHTKLNGIDTGATDDQTGAEIKTAYEAEANAYTDAKNTKLAGIETGATKYPDTGEQAFLDADHTKLNGIENSATADQTDTEIRDAVEAATNSNTFTDADHTKLNGIEAAADVTDATNVEAAGAVMHEASSTTTISAATGITVTKTLMRIVGNMAAVDITANPQIAAGTDGQIVILQGTYDAWYVKIDDGDGVVLAGGASFSLGNTDTLMLAYDSGDSTWIEISRSNN